MSSSPIGQPHSQDRERFDNYLQQALGVEAAGMVSELLFPKADTSRKVVILNKEDLNDPDNSILKFDIVSKQQTALTAPITGGAVEDAVKAAGHGFFVAKTAKLAFAALGKISHIDMDANVAGVIDLNIKSIFFTEGLSAQYGSDKYEVQSIASGEDSQGKKVMELFCLSDKHAVPPLTLDVAKTKQLFHKIVWQKTSE